MDRRKRSRRRLAFAGIILAGALALAAYGIKALHRKIPAPTGELKVGRTTLFFTDSRRQDPWASDPNQKRQLKVYLWYPALSNGAAKAVYFPDLPKLSGYSMLEGAVLAQVSNDTLESPPIAKDPSPFPVLLFSPGASMASVFYTGLIEDLVSHGYVVAAVEHTYDSPGQVLEDGKVAANLAEKLGPKPNDPEAEKKMADYFQKRIGIRSEDLSFVLTQLGRLNQSDPKFKGTLQLDRPGVFGHSIGGQAAALAATRDHRFRAAANMDGLSYGRARTPSGPGEEMRGSFLHLGKPLREYSDAELQNRGIDKSAYDASGKELRARADAALAEVKGGAFRVIVDSASHLSFSDDPILDPRASTREKRVSAIIRPILREYFDSTLGNTKRRLLDAASPMDGVHIESFGPFAKGR